MNNLITLLAFIVMTLTAYSCGKEHYQKYMLAGNIPIECKQLWQNQCGANFFQCKDGREYRCQWNFYMVKED